LAEGFWLIDGGTLRRLEFPKILEQLANYADSALGKEKALALQPVTDLETACRRQKETAEGCNLLRFEPLAEIGGWHDLRNQLERAKRGAVLEPEEFLFIADTLAAARRIGKFLSERRERYPLLSGIASRLAVMPDLEQKIRKAILPAGEVADHASPELAQIRRSLNQAQARVKERLEQIIRSPGYQKYLQEPIVTIREGRYVVPVKVEYRGRMPGIVHDQSASGATLFIEPMAVVEENNELRRLKTAEKQEVERILTVLSVAVARVAGELGDSLAALGELDFILAKARYSRKLNASAPVLEEGAFLDIRQGRHPLLQGQVVPVDIRLGIEFDILVITGPNTGGKTVVLKTAGLLALMAQAGLHLPADGSSRLGVFHRVFADIGDEQSIEQSLSTFSSHMTNIVDIMQKAGRDSLVLLDELGAGTDPVEGAALAQAILERLQVKETRTIATTHYNELKNLAYTREGMENASVEFDAVTLRPTYRLLTGRPGRSNAFEIAVRIGLPREIIVRAGDFLTAEQARMEELLRDVEKARQEAETNRETANRLKEEAARLKDQYEKMISEISSRREELLTKARAEARMLVKSARLEAKAVVDELKAGLAKETGRERANVIQKSRQRLVELQHTHMQEPAAGGEIPAQVQVGEEVFLPQFNQHGYVQGLSAKDGEVQVQVGAIKLSVPLSELRKAVKRSVADSGQERVASVLLNKTREISSELSLRGLYVNEALLEVEKYLDNASLAGLFRVSLIHGKGTGSLREAIHRYLTGHQRVKSFRLGDHNEGGSGVTVVELS
jgi:DNA mismatch repair protein MutS2